MGAEIIRGEKIFKDVVRLEGDTYLGEDNLDTVISGLEGDISTAQGAAEAAQSDADTAQGDAETAQAAVETLAAKFAVGSVQLNGVNPTTVLFGADTAATVTGTGNETFDLSANGLTVIATPDAEAAETFTFTFVKGKHESGANPIADISAGVDDRFFISIDGADAEEVVLTLANCNTEANTAAEMQTKIRALASGQGTNVTVGFAATKFTITSPTLGTDSSVTVTDSPTKNICEELKLGATGGGTSTAGTGPAADATAVSASDVVDHINASATNLVAAVDGDSVRLYSATEGRLSKITMGNGTANTALGFTNANVYLGKVGLDFAADMADANYVVLPILKDIAQAQLADKGLSIKTKTTAGFLIECETANCTDTVTLLIYGTPAE